MFGLSVALFGKDVGPQEVEPYRRKWITGGGRRCFIASPHFLFSLIFLGTIQCDQLLLHVYHNSLTHLSHLNLHDGLLLPPNPPPPEL